jgi:hypothetical protein
MRKFLHSWRVYPRKVVVLVVLLVYMVTSMVLAPVRNLTFGQLVRAITTIAAITTIPANFIKYYEFFSSTSNHTSPSNAPTQHDVPPPPPRNVSAVPTQPELPQPKNLRVIGSR